VVSKKYEEHRMLEYKEKLCIVDGGNYAATIIEWPAEKSWIKGKHERQTVPKQGFSTPEEAWQVKIWE